jgi:hypothetical protein
MVEPVYVDVAVERMGEMTMFAMDPGRFVFGVKLSCGLLVGGRGAGPGFMNCPDEKLLPPLLAMVIDSSAQEQLARLSG